MFLQDKDDDKTIKLSFRENLAYPLQAIAGRFKDFMLLICLFSLIVSVISFCLGRSFFCVTAGDSETGFFCSQNVIAVLFSVLVSFLGLIGYVSRIRTMFVENKKFEEVIKIFDWKQEARSAFVVFAYLFFWLLVCGGWAWLMMRKPVTDWRIELSCFVVVSMFILIGIYMLLNFVVFERFLNKKTLGGFRKIFWIMFDNIYKPIACFFIYLLIFAYLYLVVSSYLMTSVNFIKALAAEFSITFVLYFMVAVIFLSLYYQERVLFSDAE